MLHNEAREMMIKAYEKTGNAKEVAECYGVDVSTVYRLARQKKRTGSVKLRTNLRGRKAILSQEDLLNIDKTIQEQPDITIDEIIEKLNLHVSNETVRTTVIKLGYTYKKKSLHASERERSRCKREEKKMD